MRSETRSMPEAGADSPAARTRSVGPCGAGSVDLGASGWGAAGLLPGVVPEAAGALPGSLPGAGALAGCAGAVLGEFFDEEEVLVLELLMFSPFFAPCCPWCTGPSDGYQRTEQP